MVDDDAGVEISKITQLDTNTRPLRDRFENDFKLVRNEQFTIPKKEGEWESYTTNRPATDASKSYNILSTARLFLKIKLAYENEKQRKDLSKTERFPYGVIALRDSIATGIPEALALQPALAWHSIVRGWIGLLCYLFEEDDGKNGKVVPHIPVLDILNTYWISGSRGLLWYGGITYASVEDVKDQFDEDVKPDSNGRVKLHNIWDKESFGTVAEGNWLKKEKHDLGHIPALILPVGSTPLIQSTETEDTIEDVGESFASNNRHLYETESRIGSYLLTMTGESARAPTAAEYDSTKGGVPIEFDRPRTKGSVVPIDVGKGQKLTPMLTNQMSRDAYEYFAYVQNRLVTGGHAPIVFGQSSQAGPAAGLNILRHESLTNLKPPQLAMETAFEWLAHECVSQYKSGGFGKMEIQGLDGSNRRFKMEVKPKDIDDSWEFEATLKPDMPQDDLGNVGMAVQTTTGDKPLLSTQTARDKWNLVEDTDLEQQNLDREKAYGIAGIVVRKIAAALKKDGDDEGAQMLIDSIAEQQERKGVASQPGSRTPARPSGTTTAATPAAPQDQNARPSAFQRFMSRLGGG